MGINLDDRELFGGFVSYAIWIKRLKSSCDKVTGEIGNELIARVIIIRIHITSWYCYSLLCISFVLCLV